MFNFVIERKRDGMGNWALIHSGGVSYYVAWYPESKDSLCCAWWGSYGE